MKDHLQTIFRILALLDYIEREMMDHFGLNWKHNVLK